MRRLVLVVALLILGASTEGCYLAATPGFGACQIEGLVLDEAAFSVSTRLGDILSPLPRAAMESAGRTFYFEKGIANHNVYRYRSESRATQEFQARKELDFSPRIGGPWNMPEGVDYRLPLADQSYAACGFEGGILMCKMIAQYGPYFVYFNAHIGTLSFQDLTFVFQSIDKLMAGCLQSLN